jgi:hypothetical protein
VEKRHVLLVTLLVTLILVEAFESIFGSAGLFVGIFVSVSLITFLWRWRAETYQMWVLEILDDAKEGVSGGDLGRIVLPTSPRNFLERLVRSGLIEKVVLPEWAPPASRQNGVDVHRYALTSKGLEELERYRTKLFPQANGEWQRT